MDRRFSMADTIAAVASPPGGAARGVLRISGPDAWHCGRTVFSPFPKTVSSPLAVAGWLALGDVSAEIPCGAFVWPNGHGYTRQPAIELHMVGSPPLLEMALRAVCAAGARPAEPGEFTLRAFLAGRLDLTQAEAVLGVIDAADRRGLDSALVQLAGGIGRPLTSLRNRLLDLMAHLEAGLDFVDEDIEFISSDDLQRQLSDAAGEVDRLARQLSDRRDSTAAVRVVLIGRPNVGKSSLFNALTGGRALVSSSAGTTRDYLTAELDLDGVRCLLIDAAGSTAAGNFVESTAQDLRERQLNTAEVRLLCLDASRQLDAWEREQLSYATDSDQVVVWTKCDLADAPSHDASGALCTSAASGRGLTELRSRLLAVAGARSGCDMIEATAARCGESLRLAADSLGQAERLARSSAGEELVAAEIRLALDELGCVVGAVYTDDLLDRIFSRFCIGK